MLFGTAAFFGISAEKSKIIASYDFNGTYGAAEHILNTGKISLEKEGDVEFVHLDLDEPKVRDGERIDFGMGQKNVDYVIDMRLRVNGIGKGSVLSLLESKLSDSDWWLGYFLNEEGNIVPHSSRGNNVLTTYKTGEWFRLSFCFDTSKGTVDIYINKEYRATDEAQKDDSGNIKLPGTFKITFDGALDGIVNADIDWIRVYEGRELLDDSYFKEGELELNFDKTVMDTKENALAVLGDATVVMTSNDNYFIGGKKLKYQDGHDAIEVDGSPMISVGLLSEILGEKAEFDSKTNTVTVGEKKYVLTYASIERDGLRYVDLGSVAGMILKKELTYDDRGCAIIADKKIEVQREHYTDRFIQFNESDVIYRFMQFDNASGLDMINDLKKKIPGNDHPRILYTDADVEYIKTRLDSNSEWSNAYKKLISDANSLAKTNYKTNYTAVPSEYQQSKASELQTAVTTLARAYLISGEEKYAEKGVEILECLISWESLDLSRSNLIGGHWSAAFAVGYDSFYDYILELDGGNDLLREARKTAYDLIMMPYYNAYSGITAQPTCIKIQDNFTGVCGGGLMSLLISLCDDGDDEQMIAYLMENCMKTLQTAVCLYYPDGGYYESVGYSQYMLTNFSLALLGMKNGFGTFYGLDGAKGFVDFGYSMTYLQSTHNNVTYHDGSRGYVYNALREIWGYLFDSPEQAAIAKRQKKLAGYNPTVEELFFYEKAIEGKEDRVSKEALDALGTDRFFFGAQSGAFTNDMNLKTPRFVGFHGGLTGLPHDMLDLGQFVFEANGVKWASDQGSDDYDLPGYFAIPDGYIYYRKRPEGKNCVVINPSNDKDENGNTYYGQTVGSRAELISLDINKPSGAYAAFDLTDAYKRDVTNYVRGYYFGDERNTLVIQDEITFKAADSELYWFMQLPENTKITLEEGGKRAVLKNGNYKLIAELCGTGIGNAAFSAMDNEPIMFERQAGEGKNSQQKLAIRATGLDGDIILAVKLKPELFESEYPSYEVTKISEWSVSGETVTNSSVMSAYPLQNGALVPFVAEKQTNRGLIPALIGGIALGAVLAVTSVILIKHKKKKQN